MFRRDGSENGVVVYRSKLMEAMGVLHGYSTRIGGFSEGEFASLNFGVVGDDAKLVSGNFRRLRDAVGMQRMVRREVQQVHEAEVVVWEEGAKPIAFRDTLQADGMVTRNKREMLTIRTADCAAVLFAGRDGEGEMVIAAAHAGWRGAIGGVLGNTVEKMVEMGVEREGIVAAVGPCVGVEAFEVGWEVVTEFERVGLEGCVVKREGWEKEHVDLKKAVRELLVRAGVANQKIDVCDRCTFDGAGDFYSYRRDGSMGRMVAVIAVD